MDLATELAVLRTRLTLENTQLGWIRTGFTFITAGIAIDKVTEALHAARVIAGHAWVKGSHNVGLLLVIGSTLVLLIATIAYVRAAVGLPALPDGRLPFNPAVLGMSGLLILTGVVLSLLILTTEISSPLSSSR